MRRGHGYLVIWSNVSMVWLRSNEGVEGSFYMLGLVFKLDNTSLQEGEGTAVNAE